MSEPTLLCALPGCMKELEPVASGEARRYCCAAHRKIARRRRRDQPLTTDPDPENETADPIAPATGEAPPSTPPVEPTTPPPARPARRPDTPPARTVVPAPGPGLFRRRGIRPYATRGIRPNRPPHPATGAQLPDWLQPNTPPKAATAAPAARPLPEDVEPSGPPTSGTAPTPQAREARRAARREEARQRRNEQLLEATRGRHDAAAVLSGALLPGEEPARRGKARRARTARPVETATGPAWAAQMREAIIAALQSLRNNRLRSLLTTVGIVAGVASVIVLVALGDGMKANFDIQFSRLANQITVTPVVGGVTNGTVPRFLTDTDVKALADKTRAPDIVALSPARVGTKITVTAGQNQDTRTVLVGCTQNYLELLNRHMMAGEWFTPDQMNGAVRNVILGPQTVNVLYGYGVDPHTLIGQSVRLSHTSFKIQGVLKSDGANDDTAIVPLSVARAYLVGDEGGKLDQVVVKAASAAVVDRAAVQATDILDGQHHIRTEAGRDFDVKTYTELLKQSSQYINFLTLFIVAVAAISLFVGGVGVANIMLVSVTERTREIGIRKAVGAPRRAILRQFLSEAVVLTGLGGVVGIGLGVGLTELGIWLIPKFTDTSDPSSPVPLPILSAPPVFIGFVVSLLIGVLAGGYPAYRAARMRPIEALRFE